MFQWMSGTCVIFTISNIIKVISNFKSYKKCLGGISTADVFKINLKKTGVFGFQISTAKHKQKADYTIMTLLTQ